MPDYSALAAKMRARPSFAVADEVSRKEFPLKLPGGFHLQLLNTPEISQVRGQQKDLDESEKRPATI